MRNRLGICLWEGKRGSGEFTSLLQPSREEMVVASTLMVATQEVKHYFFFIIFFSIYLVALGLNCHMQDLQSFLWHARSRFLIRDGTWPSALGAKS